ncbi:hypothetical protein O181_011098 [Austropuccinia psidii MF-1]|uniref:Reverse transcriptase/retrotransposon-derived protein RNase H-like domain-containing protein n=1 Tax=Austropuccinia psidii MF-1 TaxID=1389203 RepID=A0A9Q3GL01_9BASI|nr:hypothetical protein [Austropuccinia psidii MF-1]
MTVCIDNAQHLLIIENGAHCSIVARDYLDNYFPNWEKQLFPTKAKNFKSSSGKMTSIGIIIKEIHKGVLTGDRLPEDDPLEDLLNEFRKGLFRTTLTSKQDLSFLKILRKNRLAFAIGEETLGKIRGHDMEQYLEVERPYPPMLRRPSYQESLGTRKEIEKHINQLLDMDFIRKIGYNDIVDITTPVLITYHDGKSRLCGDFRALNNYTKDDRYPLPRMPHALEKLAKKYIIKMDCMKGFHQNGVRPNSMKLLRIICHMGIYEVLSKCTPINLEISLKKCNFGQQELLALGHKVSGLSLAIDQNKVAAVLQKPVPKNIKEMQSFLGFASYYRNHIKDFCHITSSLYKLCSKDVVFEITKERRDAYDRIKDELTNSAVLIFTAFQLPFKLYIDSACSQGLGAAPHQRQIVDGEPREGVICYISRQLKYAEARHILRWKIAIQDYGGNMTIIYKEGRSHTNADGLNRWPLDNVKSNPDYDPEVAAK